MNGKVIGGLAWAGLALILAVPSADIVSAQLSPKPALSMTADTDLVQTASVGTPVDVSETAQPMPSYITVAPMPTTTTKPTVKVLPPSGTTSPVVVNVPVPATDPGATDVASIDPVAPVPYPANMRPKTPVVTDPVVTAPVIVEEQVAALPAVERPTVRRPPAPVETERFITEQELEGWDSGTLADYLETRGLMANASSSREPSTVEYDPDGFFLDEGPNSNDRNFRSRSRNRDFRGDGFFFVPN